ncbi:MULTISPECIES: oxidoreductase-like domain-containing protein [unclassified Alteromonas]|jgi:hypothetical protein|uniref:oxidoreductase-like domain-containing protein n=1 Tax=unclassified Alteromonas TaxID=2614992 RepID=UPI000B678DD0|nr:oxidoreductase-like domain-containing protein [Alteromonas sp.]MAI37195.1 hypothetical protein [Alteromonas sp.]OUX89438.1 MAG: hypothetical protein CBB95_06035 [Alteromonas sp. TMED35]|tara:strand:- start:25999 stop:26175 length:177 start_codon:yes stop_codon:yes gene_type:complete
MSEHTKNNLPPEPEKPLKDDCCGGGSCCPCVWDAYFEKLDEWKDKVKMLEKERENTNQ